MATRRDFVVRSAAALGGLITLSDAGCGRDHPASARRRTASAGASLVESGFEGRRAGDPGELHGLALRWCPSGRFTMGSPPGEAGRRPDEAQVSVTLSRGFWNGAFEVSQGEWRRIVGAFPDRQPSAQFGLGDDHPAYWVSHTEAEHFCARLTSRAADAGELPPGWAVRLPTEAQWEYACRAGTSTATAFGDRLKPALANFSSGPAPAPGAARAAGGSAPVGRHPANDWGIHDMHGNVWEWCRDWYHARLPGGADPDLSDRVGVRNGDGTYSRVRRGGAWIEEAWACRSACRLRYEPDRRSDHIGFRVVVVRVG